MQSLIIANKKYAFMGKILSPVYLCCDNHNFLFAFKTVIVFADNDTL